MTSSTLSPARTEHIDDERSTDNPVGAAVRAGLSCQAKSLPAWLFYDEQGSQLFEQITTLPEYYLTRTERSIFLAKADHIVAHAMQAGNGRPAPAHTAKLRILELGAGTASKTGILLTAAVKAQGLTQYLPVDVSASAMGEACAALTRTLPQVSVLPQIANYVTDTLAIPVHDGPTLALYIGSSIGNFSPDEAASILRNLREQLRAGDTLLLGTDLVKDAAVLEAAYNDAAGITAAFNLNVLRRLNRELGADFDLTAFQHVALFNQAASRIEMRLRSKLRQTVHLPQLDMRVEFQPGETIHTENSYKFTQKSIADLLQQSGFAVAATMTDARQDFAVTLGTAQDNLV